MTFLLRRLIFPGTTCLHTITPTCINNNNNNNNNNLHLKKTLHLHQKKTLHVHNKLHDESSTTPSATSFKQFNLSFEEYIKLKGKLRQKQRLGGVLFAIGSSIGSSFTLALLYPDMFEATPENVQLILGLDPLVFSGVSCSVAALLGYGLGGGVTKFLWSLANKSAWNDLADRDKDFLDRLNKFRFDGDSKFEDDYYGESIKNLSDYRQWIRTHQKRRSAHQKHEVQALKSI